MHQSIPAVPIPPSRARVGDGAFSNVASPEGGASAYLGSTPRAKQWSESRIRYGDVYRPRRGLRLQIS